MRQFVNFVPTFWTGTSGSQLRGHSDAQTLAVYLMSAPHSSITGLYYQPISTILHETGLTLERFKDAMKRVTAAEIAWYDMEQQVVWVPEHFKYQVRKPLSKGDNRRRSIERELHFWRKHPYRQDFMQRYAAEHQLRGHDLEEEEQSRHKQTRHEPASSPHNSPVARESDREPSEALPTTKVLSPPLCYDHDPDPDRDPASELETRAKLWINPASSTDASLRYPEPHRWPEVTVLFETLARLFSHRRIDRPRTPQHPGVQAALHRYAEGLTPQDCIQALDGAAKDPHLLSNPQFQTLQTVLRDEGQVARFRELAQAPPKRPKGAPPQPDHGYSAAKKYGKDGP